MPTLKNNNQSLKNINQPTMVTPGCRGAMKGQAREVRGKGIDGGGGDKRSKSPTTALTKIVALALPAIIDAKINC